MTPAVKRLFLIMRRLLLLLLVFSPPVARGAYDNFPVKSFNMSGASDIAFYKMNDMGAIG